MDDLVDEGGVSSSVRTDPWGNAWIIECPAPGVVSVRSAGQDGELGTDDDVDTGPGGY